MKAIAAILGLVLTISVSSVAFASEGDAAVAPKPVSDPVPFICVIGVTGSPDSPDIPYIHATVQIVPTQKVAAAAEAQDGAQAGWEDDAANQEILPVEKGMMTNREMLPVHRGMIASRNLSD